MGRIRAMGRIRVIAQNINQEVMRSFSNFKNGTAIYRLVEGWV